jgi:hypothetical protein
MRWGWMYLTSLFHGMRIMGIFQPVKAGQGMSKNRATTGRNP